MKRAVTLFASLPAVVLQRIFAFVPVQDRLRYCTLVCRAWRALLADRRLWAHLDLTDQGVRAYLRTRSMADADALLRCAAARVCGELAVLRIDTNPLSREAIFDVVAANADALRELHLSNSLSSGGITLHTEGAVHLLRMAPQLRELTVHGFFYVSNVADAHSLLRNKGPFGPLRVTNLLANLRAVEDPILLAAFAADLAAHPALEELRLSHARLATLATLDAFVDAAVAQKLTAIWFDQSLLPSELASSLSRLTGMAELRSLSFTSNVVLAEQSSSFAGVLADALRGNTTLTSLVLEHYHAVGSDPAGDAALLRVLTGHPRLRELRILRVDANKNGNALIGAALGALVAANSPALTKLTFTVHDAFDDFFRPLYDALPSNTHLRTLECNSGRMSEAFKIWVLLPALRANTSLRELNIKLRDGDKVDVPDWLLDEAMLLVRERSRVRA